MRTRLIAFIAIVQSVLCLTHLLLYETWTFQPAQSGLHGRLWMKLTLAFMSLTFVAASLLAFRYTNVVVRVFYRAAAVWLGLLSFLSLAAAFTWVIFGV